MADRENGETVGRRISRRRSGFAFSGASVSDSTQQQGGNINDGVERMVNTPPSSLPPPEPPQTIAGTPSEDFNPQGRLAQVRRRSTTYEREYRLNLLHRLMMRGVPLDEIANQLGISVSQVYRDRDELKERHRASSRSLDIDEIIGDSKGYYEEAGAMAMRAASKNDLPYAMRLAAVRTALAAKNDMHRFFQTAGVYDVLRFRKAQDGNGTSDVRRLMENTERLLSGGLGDLSGAVNDAIDSGDQENLDL
jgi:transposase-like protein